MSRCLGDNFRAICKTTERLIKVIFISSWDLNWCQMNGLDHWAKTLYIRSNLNFTLKIVVSYSLDKLKPNLSRQRSLKPDLIRLKTEMARAGFLSVIFCFKSKPHPGKESTEILWLGVDQNQPQLRFKGLKTVDKRLQAILTHPPNHVGCCRMFTHSQRYYLELTLPNHL